MGWKVSLLPVPHDWGRTRYLLAPLAARALDGNPPPPHELEAAVADAYSLSRSAVAPLVEWTTR